MNKKIAILGLMFAAAAPVAVFGQVSSDEQSSTSSSTIRQKMQEKRESIQTKRTEMVEKRQETKEEFKDKFQENKEKMIESRCKNIEARIATRLNRYENDQQMLKKVYSNMTARLDRLTAKLDDAGADTAKLKTDLATLKTMIDKLYADHATFMSDLKETQSFACGKSEGEFKEKLGEARNVLPTIKQAREEIREFFKTVIKPDLQEIRAKLAEEKAADEEDTETENN